MEVMLILSLMNFSQTSDSAVRHYLRGERGWGHAFASIAAISLAMIVWAVVSIIMKGTS
jgi:hypothetical protein